MYRGDIIVLDDLLSNPLVDVAWGKTVFDADGDLNKVVVAMDCLGDGDWEYKGLIFQL